MHRKDFVKLAALGSAAVVTGGLAACSSKLNTPTRTAPPAHHLSKAVYVPNGKSRFEDQLMIWGVIPLQIKVSGKDNGGSLFVFEHVDMGKGGPPRHFHYEQDEWFYVREGTFAFEVGEEKFTLRAGDSLFAPRMIPHAWAHVDDKPGTLLLAVQPAGSLEAFFMDTVKSKQPPSPEVAAQQFAAHGMKVVGPPLSIG